MVQVEGKEWHPANYFARILMLQYQKKNAKKGDSVCYNVPFK